MQLLKSFEHGEFEGLGLISGSIVPLAADISPVLKVPHMGWNRLEIIKDDPIFKHFNNGEWVYYVHSYYAKNCSENTLGLSEYGVMVPGLVRSVRLSMVCSFILKKAAVQDFVCLELSPK